MAKKRGRATGREAKAAEKAAAYGRILENLNEARSRERSLRCEAADAANEVERLTVMARQFILTD